MVRGKLSCRSVTAGDQDVRLTYAEGLGSTATLCAVACL